MFDYNFFGENDVVLADGVISGEGLELDEYGLPCAADLGEAVGVNVDDVWSVEIGQVSNI